MPEGSPRVALETLNARLARRLRRGGDSAFDEAAWPVLMAGAREKLAVLRPGYDRYDSAGGSGREALRERAGDGAGKRPVLPLGRPG